MVGNLCNNKHQCKDSENIRNVNMATSYMYTSAFVNWLKMYSQWCTH